MATSSYTNFRGSVFSGHIYNRIQANTDFSRICVQRHHQSIKIVLENHHYYIITVQVSTTPFNFQRRCMSGHQNTAISDQNSWKYCKWSTGPNTSTICFFHILHLYLTDAEKNVKQQMLLIWSSCGGNKNYWFEVVVVVNITVTVFYSVTSCREGQTAGSSKMLAHVYHSIWHHFLLHHHLHKAFSFYQKSMKTLEFPLLLQYIVLQIIGRKSCSLNCHLEHNIKNESIYFKLCFAKIMKLWNPVLPIGYLKETNIFYHESERKKCLFLTTFHGWNSKSVTGCLQQCFNETYLVTQVTAKKCLYPSILPQSNQTMGVTYVLCTTQFGTPKWK
jgi:hypothetical protein